MTSETRIVETGVVMRMVIDAELPKEFRSALDEGRLIYTVKGGSFEGDRLRGTVLPVTGDWVMVIGDSATIDARMELKTDDGARICVTCSEEQELSQDVSHVLADSDGSLGDYTIRISATFRTQAPHYAWLDGQTLQAEGFRSPRGLEFTFRRHI